MHNNIYYCEECRKKKGLPVGKINFATVGPCCFCKTYGDCHEVSEDVIPKPKPPKVLEGFEKWCEDHKDEISFEEPCQQELYRSAYDAGCIDGYHEGYWNN